MAEIFIYLLVAHFIGDWIIQTSWMAAEKSKNFLALLTHVVTYHVFTFGALYLVGIDLVDALWATLFLAVTHAFLDNRRFEIWWIRKIKKSKDEEIPMWLLIGVDQSFHFVLFFIVSAVLS